MHSSYHRFLNATTIPLRRLNTAVHLGLHRETLVARAAARREAISYPNSCRRSRTATYWSRMRTLRLAFPLQVLRYRVKPSHSFVRDGNIEYLVGGIGHAPRFLPKDGVRSLTLQGVLIPPAVFSGLLLALWLYKCCMMVVFQNKIIYMPSVPPFSRSEKIADYVTRCRPVEWREQRVTASDGTSIAIAVGSIPATFAKSCHTCQETTQIQKHKVILYLQG